MALKLGVPFRSSWGVGFPQTVNPPAVILVKKELYMTRVMGGEFPTSS